MLTREQITEIARLKGRYSAKAVALHYDSYEIVIEFIWQAFPTPPRLTLVKNGEGKS